MEYFLTCSNNDKFILFSCHFPSEFKNFNTSLYFVGLGGGVGVSSIITSSKFQENLN